MSEPSFSNGFASPWYGGRMKYPDLWKGCVGYWPPLLGPTGATLFDVSGYSNHGTLANIVTSTDWQVNRYGHVVDLNGSSQYVNVPHHDRYNASDGLSISAWVRPDSVVTYAPIAAKWKDNTTDRCWGLAAASGGEIYFYTSTNGSDFPVVWTANNVMVAGAWHHVVATNDANNVTSGKKIFVNGIERASGAGSALADKSLAIYLGGAQVFGGSAAYLNGLASEFALWDRALSPSEITFLAQRPGIMLELDDSDVWGAIEAGGSVPWWAFANRQSRIIGGGVA